MKYLLDTDVIIDHLRRKKSLESSVVRESGISIITYGELVYGAQKSHDPNKAISIVEDFLGDFSIEVVSLNREMVFVYAKLKASLEAFGNSLAEFDLLIASTALEQNLSLVTRNKKHFERIPSLQLH